MKRDLIQEFLQIEQARAAKAQCVGHIDASGIRLNVHNVRATLRKLDIPHTLPPRSTLPGSTITDTE